MSARVGPVVRLETLVLFNNQQVKTTGKGNPGSEIIHGSPSDKTNKKHRDPLSRRKN